MHAARLASLAAIVAVATLTACPTTPPYIECDDDTSCGLAAGGRCLVNDDTGHQFCAYPDGVCPTGMRWSDLDVEDSISGKCVIDDSACLIAYTRADGLYVVNPDGTGIAGLTSGSDEAAPAWSPDGTRILFERMANGAKDIFVVNVDGTGLTNLTNAAGDDYNAAWSPDGSMISFASERNYQDSETDVFVMEADGRNPRMVDIKAGVSSWSPNGDRLAYSSYKTNRFQIYTANPDGTGVTNITNSTFADSAPRWSPDGSRIAFMGLRGGFGASVYIMDADGANQRSLVPMLQHTSRPVWSPDGARIAINGSVSVDAESDVYRVNADGSGILNLTPGVVADDRDAAWSPDGSRLVIVTSRDGNQEIYRINDDATGPLRLSTSEFFAESAPAWSPCR